MTVLDGGRTSTPHKSGNKMKGKKKEACVYRPGNKIAAAGVLSLAPINDPLKDQSRST